MSLLIFFKTNPQLAAGAASSRGGRDPGVVQASAAPVPMGVTGVRSAPPITTLSTMTVTVPVAGARSTTWMTTSTSAPLSFPTASARRDGSALVQAVASTAFPIAGARSAAPAAQAAGTHVDAAMGAARWLGSLPAPTILTAAGVLLPTTAHGPASAAGVVSVVGVVTAPMGATARGPTAPAPDSTFGIFFSMPAAGALRGTPTATFEATGIVSVPMPVARSSDRAVALTTASIAQIVVPCTGSSPVVLDAAGAAGARGVVMPSMSDHRATAATTSFGQVVYFFFGAAGRGSPSTTWIRASYVITTANAQVLISLDELRAVEVDLIT